MMITVIVVLICSIGYAWITRQPVDDVSTFRLNSKQSTIVTNCWGEGGEAVFQNDGIGGIDVVCKAEF